MAAGVDGAADPSPGPERWCYAGERPLTTVPVGDGWAAVTTHRLLLFDPSGGGPRLRAVDRPNVLGVRVAAGGTASYLARLPQLAVYALVLLGGRVGLSAVDVSGLLSTDVPDAAGIGGLTALLSAFRLGFGLLSTGLLLGGVACACAAVALAGLYLRSRRTRLVVDRAGDDPIEHPISGAVDVDRLRAALGE